MSVTVVNAVAALAGLVLLALINGNLARLATHHERFHPPDFAAPAPGDLVTVTYRGVQDTLRVTAVSPAGVVFLTKTPDLLTPADGEEVSP